MSNCKRQSRDESFLQIENRRKEHSQASELAVNKTKKATWFLGSFIWQVNIDIFLLNNTFSSWKRLIISSNFEESSATYKARSIVAGIFGAPSLRPEMRMFICTSPTTGCKDKNILWLEKFQWANLARKRSWKWNGSGDWLISWKECCSAVSSHFFWGKSVAWRPNKRLRRRQFKLWLTYQLWDLIIHTPATLPPSPTRKAMGGRKPSITTTKKRLKRKEKTKTRNTES